MENDTLGGTVNYYNKDRGVYDRKRRIVFLFYELTFVPVRSIIILEESVAEREKTIELGFTTSYTRSPYTQSGFVHNRFVKIKVSRGPNISNNLQGGQAALNHLIKKKKNCIQIFLF